MSRVRKALIWGILATAISVPIFLAALSPLLAWRDPEYILAGFAGIIAMSFLLIQPLLVGGYLPGLPAPLGRRVHRVVGACLVLAVLAHVLALWITSPPDVIDVFMLASPTPFSIWAVIAFWAVLASALLGASHSRMRKRLRTWRIGHTAFVMIAVIGSVVHAMLVEDTMETMSKAALCALVLVATAKLVTNREAWATRRMPR